MVEGDRVRRVLHVDDDEAFLDLSATFLERTDEDLVVHSETSADAGLAYFEDHPVDCIVSDHDMPGLNGIEFLTAVRERDPDVPFILFTGKGSEEIASEAISAGVTDYLQKDVGSDQYTVLANRVTNAVDRSRAEQQVAATESQLQAIVEHTSDAILIIDADSRIRFANPAVERLFGYTPAELDGESLTTLMPPAFRERHLAAVERFLASGERTVDWESIEMPGQHRDGEELPLSISFGSFTENGERRFIGILRKRT